MSASQNKKKTLSLGLALIPVISMLLLLIIGFPREYNELTTAKRQCNSHRIIRLSAGCNEAYRCV